MKGFQNKKGQDLQKPLPGCMGRMVNLFDFTNNLTGTKLLTEKPHRDISPVNRNHSDSMKTPVDQRNGDLKRNSIKLNGAPMKMLIEEEMWREESPPNQNPPSVIARLMGLNSLPESESITEIPSRRKEISPSSKSKPRKEKYEIQENLNPYEKKMQLVRQKFAEAKRLATEEKLFHSREFQDALQFLSSNRDLFVKFLEEPNSLFSKNPITNNNISSNNNNITNTVATTTTTTKHITVLKPSDPIKKMKGGDCFKDRNFEVSNTRTTQPTRIVVLKPSLLVKTCDDSKKSSVRKEESFRSLYTSDSIGSLNFGELEGDVSDIELYTPTSGRSWEYNNNNSRIGSPYSNSCFSEMNSNSRESPVVREAKKRLVERWAMVVSSSSRNGDEREANTLGDVLTINNDETKKEKVQVQEEERKDEGSSVSNSVLSRSKSEPVSVSYESNESMDKSKSGKGSIMSRISSLFFSNRNKKLVREENANATTVSSSSFGRASDRDYNYSNDDLSQSSIASEVRESEKKLDQEAPVVGTNGEAQDQPSPISVLETPFICENPSDYSSDCPTSLPPQALSRSPPIGSVARSLSWDNSQFEVTSPNSLRLSRLFSRADDELDSFTFIQKLLISSGLYSQNSQNSTGIYPSLDLSLLYYDNSDCNKLDGSAKSKERLLFDSVNEALIDISQTNLLHKYPSSSRVKTESNNSGSLVNEVWSVIRNWSYTFERYFPGGFNGGSFEMDLIVKLEITGTKWEEKNSFELFDLNREICGMVLDDLVGETLLEF